MNFVDCYTNELEFRICKNCKNSDYKVHKPFKNVNFNYQRLLTFVIFTINGFIKFYYFWTLTQVTVTASNSCVAS